MSVSGDDVATMELAYERRPVAPGHYGDPDLDALLEHYRGRLGDTVVTIPRVAIECIRRLRELAGDRLLVLSARQGAQHRGVARLPRASRSSAATAAASR